MKTLDWNDEIPFGKYEGYTIREVFEKDVTYLRWFVENVDDCRLSVDVQEEIP